MKQQMIKQSLIKHKYRLKRLMCGWFQIKRLEPSYCLSTIRRDWQSFNTRTIGREPVGRSHALAYGMVAATFNFYGWVSC